VDPRDEQQGAGPPRQRIDRLTAPIRRFLQIEAASGAVLLACTLVALALSNSTLAEEYLGFWRTNVALEVGAVRIEHSLQHWINDGLMALFFFAVGLEVKRELVHGELREARRAVLPVAAALGGMVVPAGIYLALVPDGAAEHGWGIPMATDIAFVVGCMAVLGSRITPGLRVLLLTLAVADDIGAILVIAVGYTDEIRFGALFLGLTGILAIAGLARLGLRSFLAYTVLGVLVWLSFLSSGIHATIAGVILGLQTPARPYLGESELGELLGREGPAFEKGSWAELAHRGDRVRKLQRAARETISPLEYLASLLHPWVGFAIMPIFALANAGVPITVSGLGEPAALAVAAGLLVGKPAGIVLFSFVAVRLGLARLPRNVEWREMVGGGFLAGIGFTMALFIADLALEEPLLDAAKVGILGGSALAAVIGMALLVLSPREPLIEGRATQG
jgi:Na+:H+ antiporter, NhaA family